MMRSIYLHGDLGKRYGRKWRLDVRTPVEAFRAIEVNAPGFMDYVRESAQSGVGYRVFIGADEVDDVQRLNGPTSRESYRVVPVIGGAAEGFAAVVAFFEALTWQQVVGYIVTTAISYGISAALAPSPKTNASDRERPENKPSYMFNGPVNVIAQGHPVPVGYGRMIVGSQVISAAINNVPAPV